MVEVSDAGCTEIPVTGCTAITPECAAIRQAVLDADILSVSVGKTVLPKIAGDLSDAVAYRYKHRPEAPLDVLIAENIHNGRDHLVGLLRPFLGPTFPLTEYVGFIETSLGKMVPIQKGSDLLKVYAEPFNTLIVSGSGFKNQVPVLDDIKAVDRIEAFVDQKLFIHNLGHVACAYFGFQAEPTCALLADVLKTPETAKRVRAVMQQSGAVVLARFPDVFSQREIEVYSEDLLRRFSNRALGDTVFRVGRDLRRKLHKSDRVMGAILAAHQCGLPFDTIAEVFAAALSFAPRGPLNEQDAEDLAFLESLQGHSNTVKIALAAGFDADETARYSPILGVIAGKLHG